MSQKLGVGGRGGLVEVAQLGATKVQEHEEKYLHKWVVQVEGDQKVFTKVELHYICPPRPLQVTRHNRGAATQATENGETASLSVAK